MTFSVLSILILIFFCSVHFFFFLLVNLEVSFHLLRQGTYVTWKARPTFCELCEWGPVLRYTSHAHQQTIRDDFRARTHLVERQEDRRQTIFPFIQKDLLLVLPHGVCLLQVKTRKHRLLFPRRGHTGGPGRHALRTVSEIVSFEMLIYFHYTR